MPKSRVSKEHKEKVAKRNKQIKKNMEVNQVPDNLKVRQVPKWRSDDKITLTGIEWEAIYNYLLSARSANMAADAVMHRAVMDGVIKIDFERLNEAGTDYVEMTEEEQKPHKESLQQVINAFKERLSQSQQPQPTEEQQEQPQGLIVDMNGNPVS